MSFGEGLSALVFPASQHVVTAGHSTAHLQKVLASILLRKSVGSRNGVSLCRPEADCSKQSLLQFCDVFGGEHVCPVLRRPPHAGPKPW